MIIFLISESGASLAAELWGRVCRILVLGGIMMKFARSCGLLRRDRTVSSYNFAPGELKPAQEITAPLSLFETPSVHILALVAPACSWISYILPAQDRMFHELKTVITLFRAYTYAWLETNVGWQRELVTLKPNDLPVYRSVQLLDAEEHLYDLRNKY